MQKHLTATAYVVSKLSGQLKVLLHFHPKLSKWIGIGGHVDENESPQEAVLREVKEETNLKIKLSLTTPFAILEEKIPEYGGELAHIHIDSIYFASCKDIKNLKIEEEYGWFSKNELKKIKLGREVESLSKQALSIFHS